MGRRKIPTIIRAKMKAEILEIIKYIQHEKKKRNRFPSHAMKMEILAVLRQRAEAALVELSTEGEIKQISTLNDQAYEINKE